VPAARDGLQILSGFSFLGSHLVTALDPRAGLCADFRGSRLQGQAEQVRSIAVERVGDRPGVAPHAIMFDVDEALRLHLGR
jgi:hypothetical protein